MIALLAGAAITTFFSGNDIYRGYCSPDVMEGLCTAYVAGVVDGARAIEGLERRDASMICIPPGVTLQQMTDVFTKSLRDDPQHRNLRASVLVLGSMMRAFPCPAK